MKTSIIICFYEKSEYLKCCFDLIKSSTNDRNVRSDIVFPCGLSN